MCGIAGILTQSPGTENELLIKNATRCLSHRGPDEENFWMNKDNTVAFGHRRLRIIDLSNKAAQPMHYLNRYVLTYNGEIYNYIELRELLKKKGYEFTSQSDAEVLLAAYHAFGKQCLHQFEGMYSFAIWDENEKVLFAARDRMGEKPFFYYYDENRFFFSSELKALWNLGAPKDVNKSMLYNFLSIGYTSNPRDPQETFYNNICKLPSASFLTFSFLTNQLTIEKYWEINPAVNSSINEKQAIEKFDHLFTVSIKNRMRSDVALGTSLSGGLDSSAIVSFCEKEVTGSYSHKCFTASFPGFNKNELKYASLVAGKFGLDLHIATIEENEVIPLMEKVMRHQEEPIGSASALAQFKVYHTAKENGVTVLLDGQGADELLAGYNKYYKWYWMELYRKRQLSRSGELRSARSQIRDNIAFGIKEKLAALLPDLASAIEESRKGRKAFRHNDLDRDFAFLYKRDLYYTTPSAFDLNGILYYNSFVNGLEELLRTADRNSMANGTEIRLPFLHHELVSFLFSLPPEQKIHNGWTKWLLRKSTEHRLPSEIVWRKDKVGFEPPQKQWMQNKAVQQSIVEAKKKLVSECILDKSVVNKKIQPHNSYAAENNDWKYWSAAFLF